MTHDVIVVGGGPVGVALAIDLGQRGVRTLVLERYDEPQRVPKGQNLTQRTMEHFRAWGAESELRAARTLPTELGIGGVTVYGTLTSGWHYDWLQRELVRPYYATDNERLPQYETERVLRQRAAAIPEVDLRCGWSVTDVRDVGHGVEVDAEPRDGSPGATFEAAYAVGCDGSRSVARRAAGIEQDLKDHDRLMALVVFRSRELDRIAGRFPRKSFFNVLHPDHEGYWQFFGRVDDQGTWFFHAPVEPGTTRESLDVKTLLSRAAGEPVDAEVRHVGFWDLRFSVARRYRVGRVMVAGDAAHSHPPYGGYGINTGFEDARNLGWKLAAVLRGWAGHGLLDSYDLERRPVFESTASDFIARSIEVDRQFLATYDPARDREAFEAAWDSRATGAAGEVDGFEPHYEGSPLVSGTPGGTTSAVGRHDVRARPGHHLAPAPLGDGRQTTDALGPHLTLLVLDADADVHANVHGDAQRSGMPLAVVTASSGEAREAYGATYVLVRPDGFVAWAGDTLEGLDDALAATVGLEEAGLRSA